MDMLFDCVINLRHAPLRGDEHSTVIQLWEHLATSTMGLEGMAIWEAIAACSPWHASRQHVAGCREHPCTFGQPGELDLHLGCAHPLIAQRKILQIVPASQHESSSAAASATLAAQQ